MTVTDENAAARLARVFDEILAEVRRDPGLAQRIERALGEAKRQHPRSGRPSHRRQPGPVDPFAVHESGGQQKLRLELEQLDVEQLKDIVAEHGMDRTKLAMKWKTPGRLIELIVETVVARAKKGDAFRQA